MDRRQLLFGATAFGLATNLNLNHLLNAQVGKAAMDSRLSDRERIGLRGPVRTCAFFHGDEAESMSEAEYALDGRLLVWRGRISGGSRVERLYFYNDDGRLIGITGGDVEGNDQFRFDERGRKTLIRTIPPKPDRQSVGTSVGIIVEATEEDGCLVGGGTITTRYNEDDQPVESLVRDAHGELLTRIVHSYDANGRLVHETLVRESFEVPDSMIPEQPRGQMHPEYRQIVRAGVKKLLGEHDALKGLERSYVYDDRGRVIVRRMKLGSFFEDMTTTYNEQGDEAGMVMTRSGSIDPRIEHDDQRFEVSYLYQYDNHGNWTEKTVQGGSSPTRRTLTYY